MLCLRHEEERTERDGLYGETSPVCTSLYAQNEMGCMGKQVLCALPCTHRTRWVVWGNKSCVHFPVRTERDGLYGETSPVCTSLYAQNEMGCMGKQVLCALPCTHRTRWVVWGNKSCVHFPARTDSGQWSRGELASRQYLLFISSHVSNGTRPRAPVNNQQTKELISARKTSHKHDNKELSRLW